MLSPPPHQNLPPEIWREVLCHATARRFSIKYDFVPLRDEAAYLKIPSKQNWDLRRVCKLWNELLAEFFFFKLSLCDGKLDDDIRGDDDDDYENDYENEDDDDDDDEDDDRDDYDDGGGGHGDIPEVLNLLETQHGETNRSPDGYGWWVKEIEVYTVLPGSAKFGVELGKLLDLCSDLKKITFRTYSTHGKRWRSYWLKEAVQSLLGHCSLSLTSLHLGPGLSINATHFVALLQAMPQLVSLSVGHVHSKSVDSNTRGPAVAVSLPHLKALALNSSPALAFETMSSSHLPSLTHMHVYDLTADYDVIVQFFVTHGSKLQSLAAFVEGGNTIHVQRILTPCMNLEWLTLELSVGIFFGENLHLPLVNRVSLLGLQNSAELDLDLKQWWDAVDMYADQLVSTTAFPSLRTVELVDISQAAAQQAKGDFHWRDTAIPADRTKWWNELVQKFTRANIPLVDCNNQPLTELVRRIK